MTFLPSPALSAALNARTDFHLLNPSPGFSAATICSGSWTDIPPLGSTVDEQALRSMVRGVSPSGSTPLTESVMSVVSMIEPFATALRQSGQQVAVIIATDGLPNHKASFLQAMMTLQTLPVWVVVRLCTDDEAVVDYWNDL